MKNSRDVLAIAQVAQRVNAALDILGLVSSSGGKGSMFSYRGTHLTYEDVRELATFALSANADKNSYPDTEADGIVFCGKCGGRK